MINLLPDDAKQTIIYGRRNVRLRKWAVILASSSLLLLLVVWFGKQYINNTHRDYTKQVEESRQALQLQKVDETEKKVEEVASSLKLVSQVLSREILFSKLLKQIGSAMPAGSILTDLTISKVQGGLDLSAQASDYQTATQIQVNLADPSVKLFDKADIISVSCNAAAAANKNQSKYPCRLQVRVLFAANNPFLFIPGANNKL